MKCNFCGQEYEFSLGHRCEVMQEESKQTQPDLVSKLRERITDYLKGGGLFNPEMAEHDRVRELLIDCHVALLDLEVSPSTPIQPEISRSVQRREAIQRGEPMPTFAPSTPIVPGTAGLSAEQVQAAIVPLLETDALLTVIPWKKIADRLNALLGAERPAPAGEVRISRWRCPHCAHVNLMISANCENCKIPLVNTAR